MPIMNNSFLELAERYKPKKEDKVAFIVYRQDILSYDRWVETILDKNKNYITIVIKLHPINEELISILNEKLDINSWYIHPVPRYTDYKDVIRFNYGILHIPDSKLAMVIKLMGLHESLN